MNLDAANFCIEAEEHLRTAWPDFVIGHSQCHISPYMGFVRYAHQRLDVAVTVTKKYPRVMWLSLITPVSTYISAAYLADKQVLALRADEVYSTCAINNGKLPGLLQASDFALVPPIGVSADEFDGDINLGPAILWLEGPALVTSILSCAKTR